MANQSNINLWATVSDNIQTSLPEILVQEVWLITTEGVGCETGLATKKHETNQPGDISKLRIYRIRYVICPETATIGGRWMVSVILLVNLTPSWEEDCM